MTWFIGIFTDILGACGMLLGGIIVFFLALLVIAFWLVVAALACIAVTALLRAGGFWFCRGMMAVTPETSAMHEHFKNKWLDMKHPSRIRRRKMVELGYTIRYDGPGGRHGWAMKPRQR